MIYGCVGSAILAILKELSTASFWCKLKEREEIIDDNATR